MGKFGWHHFTFNDRTMCYVMLLVSKFIYIQYVIISLVNISNTIIFTKYCPGLTQTMLFYNWLVFQKWHPWFEFYNIHCWKVSPPKKVPMTMLEYNPSGAFSMKVASKFFLHEISIKGKWVWVMKCAQVTHEREIHNFLELLVVV